MPVIRDMHLTLETAGVLRRAGFKTARTTPETLSLVRGLLAEVDEAGLLEPAAAYEIYPLAEITRRHLLEQASALSGAEEAAIVVGTIGPGVEKAVTAHFKRGEPLKGVLLDGLGNAAVDSLTEEVSRLLASRVSRRGYRLGSPINPGTSGLPITRQRQLFQMAPAGEIGVTLTQSGVMVPLKSVSMVLGIGPHMAGQTRARICAACRLGQTCSYRAH